MSLPAFSSLAPETRQALQAIAVSEAVLNAAIRAVIDTAHARDGLECHPAVVQKAGGLFRPVVIVMVQDRPLTMSADAARRIAVRQQADGREGVAHDLLGAADLAEQIASQLQRGMN